jgi:hypothetical protein
MAVTDKALLLCHKKSVKYNYKYKSCMQYIFVRIGFTRCGERKTLEK